MFNLNSWFNNKIKKAENHTCSTLYDGTIELKTDYINRTQTLKCLVCDKILWHIANTEKVILPWNEIRDSLVAIEKSKNEFEITLESSSYT